MKPYVLLDDQKTGITRYFSEPLEIIKAVTLGELDTAFARIENYYNQGCYLAGYFAYELGYALEPALRTHVNKSKKPLLELGVFTGPPKSAPAHCLYTKDKPDLHLSPNWTFQEYKERFDIIQKYIEAGDVYQVNLTFPMMAQTQWPAHQLYAAFRRAQPGRYGGIVSLSDAHIISLSPELFFKKSGNAMCMRPMKGTRPRNSDARDDAALLHEMRNEPKSQAENLMIVDLLRNDLSRLCEAGSVSVPELFALETYPTVHQMTSQVEGYLKPGQNWHDILTGLFPCGSVTGAPKIRAMEIIRELENAPRDIYCGSMGYIAPDGSACFNVAIRTMQLKNKTLQYNVGSGIVLDSVAKDEYEECLLKADVLKTEPQGIFETFRWEAGKGYIRLEAHLERLERAAKVLHISYNLKDVNERLDEASATFDNTPKRIRLSLSHNGQVSLSSRNLTPLPNPLRVAISKRALTKSVQTTEHKVDYRDFYDGERERLHALYKSDEVLFLDENGFAAEGSFTSLFIEEKSQIYTPKMSHILPGILRAELLMDGTLQESEISFERLIQAETLYMGNSLRGLMRAKLISKERL